MTCDTLLEDLAAYRDRELPLARRLAVHWHLAHCAACREELTFMETITEELRASEPAELDPALRAKLLENLPEPISESVPTMPPRRNRPNIMKLGVATVVAVTLAGIYIQSTTTYNAPTLANRRIVGNMNESEQQELSEMRHRIKQPNVPPSTAAEAPAPGPPSLVPKSVGAPKAASPAIGDGPGPVFSDGHVNDKALAAPSDPNAGSPPGANSNDNLPPSMRLVHKEGHLSVDVKVLEDQSDEVTQSVTAAGGYVVTTAITGTTEGGRQANFDIRVPAGKFDAVVTHIAKLGTVQEKHISGEDITDQTSDSQGAFDVYFNDMSTKEAQLQEAQKQHRGDQTQLESELRELRIQTAQAKARLENLKRLGSMSNLQVELREKPAAPKATGFLGDIGDNGSDAYGTFIMAARVPLNALLWLLAYSPIWLPALAILYFWNRKVGSQKP